MLRKGAALLKDKGYTVLTSYDGNGVKTGATVVDPDTDATINGTTTPTVTPVMYDKTNAYTNPNGSTYYHLDASCTTLKNALGTTKLSDWYKGYSQVSGKTLCSNCNHKWVYYGAEGYYHYDKNCSHMLSGNYSTIYQTTELTAKGKGWSHTCTVCK